MDKEIHYHKLAHSLYMISHGFMIYPSEDCFIDYDKLKREQQDKIHYKCVLQLIKNRRYGITNELGHVLYSGFAV